MKEITKKVYNNIMNSMKFKIEWILYMNSKNSGTSDPHKILLNLTDIINLKRSDKYVSFWKNTRKNILKVIQK